MITKLDRISDIATEFGTTLSAKGQLSWFYANKNPASPVQPVMGGGKISDWIGYDHYATTGFDLKKLYKFIDFSEIQYNQTGKEVIYGSWTTLPTNQGVGGIKFGEELRAIGKIRWPNAVDGRIYGAYLYPSTTIKTGMQFQIPLNTANILPNANNVFIMFAVVSFSEMTSREPILGWDSYRNHPNANSIQSIDNYWAIWYGTKYAYLAENDITTTPKIKIETHKPFLVALFGNSVIDVCGYVVWDISSPDLTNFNTYYGNIWNPKSTYYTDVLGKQSHVISICNGDGFYMKGVHLRMIGYDGSGLITDMSEFAKAIHKQYWLYK
ncbi:hypothetical protein [uncultured Alistipes sp.]|uniref:hypothetical protein n=1 Tax=uncultured Alistipes sp. TaxID=538949 RepID=UPI00266F04C5|nr:hypothetical protein [uncultured Alistipes sp.]